MRFHKILSLLDLKDPNRDFLELANQLDINLADSMESTFVRYEEKLKKLKSVEA